MNSSMSSRYWKIILPLLIIIAGLAVLPQVIAAQSVPPPAAITACENKSQGDACEFTASGGATITGACLVVQDVLACVPGDPPTETPSATSPTPSATPTATPASSPSMLDYTIVDTGQTGCYSDAAAISCPSSGAAYYGQDAQHAGVQPSYQDNGDGTVTDLNTGLMWQQTPDSEKSTFAEAVAGAAAFDLAGYDDWRLPTIKELYSLIDFNGNIQPTIAASTPYIDTDYFDFEYGDESAGERLIDAQYWSSTEYVGTTMGGNATTFGVNFADGRIKGYGSGGMTQFVRYVRANPSYGVNNFDDNPLTGPGQAGTITDLATGLMWQGADSGATYNWDGALGYCNDLSLAGHDDWRLPNAKELQSIVDYTRAPDAQDPAQQSAAIDPIFNITSDDVYFWSSTTHMDGPNYWGAYVAFGEAWGYMEQPPDSGNYVLLNVHGAGAQRSDPKVGDPADWPNGNGPQGDVVRIYNYARCVRDADTVELDRPYKLFIPLAMREAEASSSPVSVSGDLNLFAPLRSTSTYLIDSDGDVVHTWASDYVPGVSVYLLENGNLLRTGNTRSENFDVGGAGGIVQEIAPDGAVVWEFEYADEQARLHHDVELLPNGNVLMIAWENKTEAQAIAAGRDPNLMQGGELWPDHVIEVNPASGAIVWEWHVWDHLVQDHDAAKQNYGVVADHPELIDLNFGSSNSDWNHINSIDYNQEFDQILLSVHNSSEIWVIDHSTSTAQAAGHSGGNSKGGDLLYRWGNPRAYDAGSAADQQFFAQHDAQWIPSGYPGEGNILVFNNGAGARNYSSVDEITPPVDAVGNYTLDAGAAYGPAEPLWTYTADVPTDFYAERISGAQRLADGNTLICDGPSGVFFEVTPEKETVWTYDHGVGVFRVVRYESSYVGLSPY